MWKKVIPSFAIFFLISLFIIAKPEIASAQTASEINAKKEVYCNSKTWEGSSFIPTWYKYLSTEYSDKNGVQSCKITTEFPNVIVLVVFAVIEILLRIVGILAVIFVIYGGFQYLTSTGEPDKAKAGRTTIINALVGLMIAMLATVIVNIVGRNIA